MKSKKNFFRAIVFFDIDNALPIRIAKNITCNISPSTNDWKGLLGMIFNKISKKEGGSETFIFSTSKLMSNPFPGWIKFAKRL